MLAQTAILIETRVTTLTDATLQRVPILLNSDGVYPVVRRNCRVKALWSDPHPTNNPAAHRP